jgi:hypothetical protein
MMIFVYMRSGIPARADANLHSTTGDGILCYAFDLGAASSQRDTTGSASARSATPPLNPLRLLEDIEYTQPFVRRSQQCLTLDTEITVGIGRPQ